MIDRKLEDLHPDLQPLCEKFVENCNALGLHVVITETFRDPAREDQLHAEGKTPATSATCKHCFTIDGEPASKAFDFMIFRQNGELIDDGADPVYAQAGAIGKALGLHWGGNFHRPDYDHMEIA